MHEGSVIHIQKSKLKCPSLRSLRLRGESCFLLIMCVLAAGCGQHVHEQIPKYPLMSVGQTLEQLRARSSGLRTVSGQGTLRLTSGDGQSVLLDAAIALQPRENLARVRAWKFGQAVFDLTSNSDGVFVVAPQDSAQRAQVLKAGKGASGMINQWLALIAGKIDSDDVQEHGDELIVRQPADAGTTLVSLIDRTTLTARSYRLLDSGGKERFSLKLSEYTESNAQVWPRRIEAISAEGKIRVIFNEVELNADLPAAAFAPPGRAEKLP